MSIIVHQPFVTRRSSSPNQFVPVIVSPLPCSSELVRHALLFVFFFSKNSFLSMAPLTNAKPAFSIVRGLLSYNWHSTIAFG